jgi:pimeloyl-ACP methyl ester carboxylesterase
MSTVRLVLLHALPLDATMWAGEIDVDVESTVAPTLYGLGDSLEAWAGAVIDQAGDGPLLVAGNSVGGSCAIEIARLAPDRVAAIVLVGAKAAVRPDPESRDRAIRLISERGMAAAWPKYWKPLFGPHAQPDVVASAREIAFAQTIDDVVCGVRVFHDRPDRSDVACTWPKPLVVVSGDHDRSPSPATTAALAASAPRGRLHVVEDCGHYVSLERPREFEKILQRVVRDLESIA